MKSLNIWTIAFLTLTYHNLVVHTADEKLNLNGHATFQSSIRKDVETTGPQLAVDGHYSHECSLTKLGKDNWWAVDLGETRQISSVIITARIRLRKLRISNLIVGLSNTSPEVSAPTIGSYDVCGRFDLKASTEQSTIICDTKTNVGRYLIVQHTGRTSRRLEICEIDVNAVSLKDTWDPKLLSTMQSTTKTIGGISQSASLAADGNIDSNSGSQSCSQTERSRNNWWSLDMGASRLVSSVIVIPRASKEHTLTGLIIGLSNVDPRMHEPKPGRYSECKKQVRRVRKGDVIGVTCARTSVPGRYLIIQLPSAHSLEICEVLLASTPAPDESELKRNANSHMLLLSENPTYQSSTDKVGGVELVASNSVDGIREGHLDFIPCSRTKSGDNPWWAVDLGEPRKVTAVIVTPRFGREKDMSNFVVGLTNNSVSETSPVPGQYNECGKYHGAPSKGNTGAVLCLNGVLGRYLVVQRVGHGQLQVCEVDIYAEPIESDPDFMPVHFALANRPAYQSSTYVHKGHSLKPTNAINGNYANTHGELINSCAHTNTERNNWWAVDLGEPRHVTSVIITSRAAYERRLEDFTVGITNDSPVEIPPVEGSITRCGRYKGKPTPNNAVSLICDHFDFPGGRFVVIYLPHLGPLTICEIDIYGY